jgi:hypothetical protein
VFTVANKFFQRRSLVLLALVVVSVVAGKAGVHVHCGFGMWDGPLP